MSTASLHRNSSRNHVDSISVAIAITITITITTAIAITIATIIPTLIRTA